MDVPEDKRDPLRQKAIAHKRDMLINYNYNKPAHVRQFLLYVQVVSSKYFRISVNYAYFNLSSSSHHLFVSTVHQRPGASHISPTEYVFYLRDQSLRPEKRVQILESLRISIRMQPLGCAVRAYFITCSSVVALCDVLV